MSDQIARQVHSSGTQISKEKLLEQIRRCSQKEFPFSQTLGSKVITVVVQL